MTIRGASERFVILKGRGMLEEYAAMFAEALPKTILEFGIFQGGSPALYSLWFDLHKFVGIDICAPVVAFDDFCRRHEAGRKIRSYYGVSQTDRGRIEEIVKTEFHGAPLDVISMTLHTIMKIRRERSRSPFRCCDPAGGISSRTGDGLTGPEANFTWATHP
jgi:hypothetical protein